MYELLGRVGRQNGWPWAVTNNDEVPSCAKNILWKALFEEMALFGPTESAMYTIPRSHVPGRLEVG